MRDATVMPAIDSTFIFVLSPATSSSMASQASSVVTMPEQGAVLVHHGHGRDVVLEDVGGHVLLFLGGKTADDVVVHDVAHEAVGVVQHERAQGVYAEQLAVFIGDVHVVHRRVILGQRAQHFDGVGHGGRLRHGHELGGHHAARGTVLIAEQPANFRGASFHAHKAQKRLGLLVGKVAHDVGGVVGVHVADELGGPGVRASRR